MFIKDLAIDKAFDHLLLHNVVDANGKRLLRKGTRLTLEQIALLRTLGRTHIEVALLDPDDIWEDAAATRLVYALQSDTMEVSWGVGGRANLHTTVDGVLYVDQERVLALNLLPGITLATLAQHAVVHPRFSAVQTTQPITGDQVATLKIIPYAVPQTVFAEALRIVQAFALLDVRPLIDHRVALVLVGDPAAHRQLQHQFEPPIRKRVEQLNSRLETVALVEQNEETLLTQVQALLPSHDMLIIAGQTSIMDSNDMTLRSLRRAGAVEMIHGAPVDPGNLLALTLLDEKPILCAPGCARSPAHNVVDLILPRLLTGERLTRLDIVRLGVGGLLRS